MKTTIIILALIIFSTVKAYSKEAVDCKNLKKFSMQYSICKTKAVLSGNAINSNKKNKANKKSFWKKFGESKSLSEVIK
jgi:hypothetical protein|tara:strand:- start:459 stop:695 length:237 start_codon:yes stop_codon:yes gene_type:complete